MANSYINFSADHTNSVIINSPAGDLLTVSDKASLYNTVGAATRIINNNVATHIIHTFDIPQYLNRVIVNINASTGASIVVLSVSTDGTNYTQIAGSNGTGDHDRILNYSQPNPDPIKIKSFKIIFDTFQNSTYIDVNYLQVFTINPSEYLVKDYNVEFDDSLIDMASWKNSRYEGSKITGAQVNYFTEGDTQYPYGLKPVIENKVCALFIGNNIQEGEATGSADPLVEIRNHSYVTIDTILLVNLDTLKSTKISFEQFNETEGKQESFRRLISDNFPEGSKIVTKILDIATASQLKEFHHVKFNQGLLMKLYAYTANINGHEDGVFGGFGVRDQKGILTNNLASGSTPGGGMFGFGMTAAVSHSLFTSSITTVDEFPSELSLYGNDVGTINSLNELTSSNVPPIDPGVFEFPTQKVI